MDLNENGRTSDFFREYFQKYVIEPNAVDLNHEERLDMEDELKRQIQKIYIRYHILEYDTIKPLLEDTELGEIYDSLSDKKDRDKAKDMIHDAIDEVKNYVALKFGAIEGRKKDHEVLAEFLDKQYGEEKIDGNVTRVINKNTPQISEEEE